ncbi:GNAT family N-acetyltransferase [Kitasatospora cineracea]
MNTPAALLLTVHGPKDALVLLNTVTEIWAAAHADHHDVAAAGFTPAALRHQITGHTRHEKFTLVTASTPDAPDRAVGFGYGFLCTPRYWLGETLFTELDSPVTSENRIAGVCELAVHPDLQGRGIGTALHRTLLDALAARWASLLAMPGHQRPEQRLYHHLGYRYAGPYQPNPETPALDLLLLYTGT